MQKNARFYLIGIACAIIALIAVELIWLPAPIRTGSGMQWIEMIDLLFYGIAIIPLCWAIGAIIGIRDRWSMRAWWNRVLLALRIMIALLGILGTYFVLFQSQKLLLLFAFVGAAALLVCIDLLLSEVLDRRKLRKARFPKRSVIVLMIIAALFVALLLPTGYQVTYPAMTMNLNRYAHVEGKQEGGMIDGVLVFSRPAVPADWLYARLLPHYEFEKIPEDEPPLTESYAQVIMMKNDANGVAAAIAMEKAGIGEGITADGVRVVAVVKDSPADGTIQAGDIIDRIDGYAVRSLNDLTSYMAESVKPGQSVTMTLRRQQKEISIEIKPRAAADDANRPVLGISIQTELLYDIPRSIEYSHRIAHIGGPSHGAMLTLAFIDQLTQEDVLHGNKVAGTGTIEPDGSIGLIGGIKQKAYAVSRTDADVFFVPAPLMAAARSGAPDLNIVPVSTIDEVLDWLAQNKK